jgi:DNA-binding IclR family transcriptional regulator
MCTWGKRGIYNTCAANAANVFLVDMNSLLSPTLPTGAVRGTQSIERATLVLRLLALHHGAGIALQDIVEQTGLDRTTTYRIASSLVEAGLASRDPATRRYRLGVETMALGIVSMLSPPLVEQCRPIMKTLARQSGDHVFLVVRSGDYSQCLHVEQGERPAPDFIRHMNSMRLLGMGIPSIAMLARLSDEEITEHYARHEAEYRRHHLDEARLRKWVKQTRELGYAHVNAQGLCGVGVRFPMGSCGDAALGIVALESKMPRGRGAALAALVREQLGRLLA